ncbi:MAG: DUF4040 domain-containing protein, partial [Gammaproteobacteria bacterium]|nr:DUF4040 domain-containing protein [Gammaproteobacteria bacterium]
SLSYLENGSLQRYISFLLIAVIVMLTVWLTPLSQITGELALTPVDPLTALGLLVMVCSALLTMGFHRQRLTALLMLSVVGLVVAMVFARFSAPDLALTQLVVEVVTILLMLLVVYFLPAQAAREASSLGGLRDVIIAACCGVLMTVLTFAVLTRPYTSIADFFLANSLTGGGGTNVVNVILVDFRGFDTLGEISVLAITAIATVALLQGLKLPRARVDTEGRAWSAEAYPMVLGMLARLILPLALLVSMYIFLRGHNEPGGGFIAGLITAVALILLQVAYGQRWVQTRMGVRLPNLAAAGVLIATATGLASLPLGYPFLTSAFAHINLPVIGEIEIASAMIFDLGVYLTVVGGTLLILSGLGRIGHTVKLPEEQ